MIFWTALRVMMYIAIGVITILYMINNEMGNYALITIPIYSFTVSFTEVYVFRGLFRWR